VYRARDPELDRVVAIKVVHTSLKDDDGYIETLRSEASLAARLQHPNITAIYDIQLDGENPFIVMEYFPTSLSDRMKSGEPLSWSDAVAICVQVARALEHAHGNRVVHRDIKPGNILLRASGEAAVSDFGLARSATSATQIQSESIAGTPDYMAPEQWLGERLSSRLDQYALGIVIFELITGRPPFQGDTFEALYVQHRERSVPRLPISIGAPESVDEIIRRSTEKDPADRFSSVGEMAGALEEVLNRTERTTQYRGILQPDLSREYSIGSHISPPGRYGVGQWGPPIFTKVSRKLAISSGFTAVLVIGIAIGFLIFRSGDGFQAANVVENPTAPASPQIITPLPIPTRTPYPMVMALPTGTALPMGTPSPTPTLTYPIIQAPPYYGTPEPTIPVNAYSSYAKGEEYHQAEQYELAIKEYTAAITADPNYSGAYYSRGNALLSLGLPEDAVKDYEMIVELVPDKVQFLGILATVYNMIGRFEDSVVTANKLIQLEPYEINGYEDRASAYTEMGEYTLAMEDAEKVIVLNPENATGYELRGNIYKNLGKSMEAVADYSTAIGMEPKARSYVERGRLYEKLDQTEDAFSDFSAAIQLDPDWLPAYIVRGNLLNSLGDFDAALLNYEAAIQVDPTDPMGQSSKSLYHKQRGEYELAIAGYTDLMALAPIGSSFMLQAYSGRASSYFNAGQTKLAIKDYDEAIRLGLDDAYFYCQRGMAYRSVMDYVRGDQDVVEALRLGSDICRILEESAN